MNSPVNVESNPETIPENEPVPEIQNSDPAPADPGPVEAPPDDDAPWGRKADGTPRKRPGRRPAGDQSELHARLDSVRAAPPRNPPPATPEPLSESAPPIAADYDAIGKVAAGLFFGAGEAAFGPDWAPDIPAKEHIQVASAFSKYFESQQMSDLSPGWTLVLTLGAYSLKRIHKPTIRERISAGITWVKSKFIR